MYTALHSVWKYKIYFRWYYAEIQRCKQNSPALGRLTLKLSPLNVLWNDDGLLSSSLKPRLQTSCTLFIISNVYPKVSMRVSWMVLLIVAHEAFSSKLVCLLKYPFAALPLFTYYFTQALILSCSCTFTPHALSLCCFGHFSLQELFLEMISIAAAFHTLWILKWLGQFVFAIVHLTVVFKAAQNTMLLYLK